MYGNLGGIAIGAGALAATGSNVSTILLVVAVATLGLGTLVALRERARRTQHRTTGTTQ